MQNITTFSLSRGLAVALAALTVGLPVTRAQSGSPTDKPPVKVAMLDLAFYGKNANDLLPDDSAMAMTATAKMRSELAKAPGLEFVDSATIAKSTASPALKTISQDRPCNVIVACARAVGQQLGAKWVVMGKVSKTSDLIWIYSGQLIDVATGNLILDDSYELKGIASDMVPKGAEVFARRVVKKVTSDSAPVVQ